MRNMILFIVHAEKVGLISLKAKMTANITRNIKLENGPGYVKFDNFLEIFKFQFFVNKKQIDCLNSVAAFKRR